ncbi:hypothetical protein Q5P01_014424 [Channa striata]|uniref:Kinesin motor domain-containing protein n=1 Tax=Channa striata TaxID=64152 RepID=A0AA88MI86_CHASR|nr:hypothetical protein Q5P01_014424 [Channa striata]
MTQSTLVYESKRTAGYNYGLPNSSPSLNKTRAGDQRIIVCVRKRPLTHADSRKGETDVVTTLGAECVIVNESKEAVDLTHYILQHRFYFDHVFGEESSNEEVYQRTAYPLVQHMLNGGKATCFAYGQTGAGKTHTMLGPSPRRPGLYTLAVRDIFAHLSTTHTHSPLLVYVSFFEIYCGQLYDLLDHRKRLFAREDGQKVVHITGLHYVRVDSVSSLLEVILQGTEERTQGISGVNPLSSRSHALLQIQLRGLNEEAAGRMWFVDLAGSERASDTKEPDRQSRMEGAEINQSLLALKECIRSLDQEQSHTPFRQSKLTQVLKDSFLGDSMTCMIANISPGYLATEHTLNTLRYADRVKELRGQGGQRGGRRSKTSSSPKHNLSNSNSSIGSVGPRGRSPPKKAKLGREREASGPIAPTTRLPMEDAILCSTPKNSRWVEETSPKDKHGLGLEHTTPIRGWRGTDKKETKERADERKRRGGENDKCGRTENSGQPADGQFRLRAVQADERTQKGNLSFSSSESGFVHREKEKYKSTLEGGREEKRGLAEQQRQTEISRDAYSDIGRHNKRGLQKDYERDEEKERHLRWYHQQLQQFMPSTASSSASLHSNFHGPSLTSLSPSLSLHSCSSSQQSSQLSGSALAHHDLEEIFLANGAKVHGELLPFPSGEICLQPETSSSYTDKNDEDPCGNSGDNKAWEETQARFGKGRVGSEKRRSEKATGKAIVRKEDERPAGIEGRERRCAWVAMTDAERADMLTGEILNNSEGQTSYNGDSKGRGEVDKDALDTSGVPADGEADSCVSIHSNSLFNHCPLESPPQRAPAEQHFPPAYEHPNTHPTTNKSSFACFESKYNRCTSNSLASTSNPKKRQCLGTYRQLFNAQSATQTCTTSIPQTGCKIPNVALKQPDNSSYTQVQSHLEVKTKMSVSAQDENDADSLYIMDPLSITLLQVDQEVATASFLQDKPSNTSVCLPENEIRGDNKKNTEEDNLPCEMVGTCFEDEDAELRLSLLQLPRTSTQQPQPSDNVTAINTERRKDTCFATNKHSTVPNLLTNASMSIFVIKIITPSANIGLSSSHSLIPMIFLPFYHQTERVLDQSNTVPSQCDTEHIHNSVQPNSPTEPNDQEQGTGNQQIRSMVHLSTLENLDRAQWCVVKAHWEKLEEMEALCHKEGLLLCQLPDMAFGEYIHKLEKIMERKAQCVHSMRAQLQPYLKPRHTNNPIIEEKIES